MRKGPIFFATLAFCAFALEGCPSNGPVNNMIEPTPTATPFVWLSPDISCGGAVSRAQWMVCDNPDLAALHRRLADQWAAERSMASVDQLELLEYRQRAMLGERDACPDAACVAAAYRRYLTSAAPAPTPTPRPTASPRPRPKPTKVVRHRPGRPHWRGPRNLSCVASVGPSLAQQLSQQCDRVTRGSDRLCDVKNSCESIRAQTREGCKATLRKPGFCDRY